MAFVKTLTVFLMILCMLMLHFCIDIWKNDRPKNLGDKLDYLCVFIVLIAGLFISTFVLISF